MLNSILTPFLDLKGAQEALQAEGFICSEKDLVTLAAHEEIRLCFPYSGLITVIPMEVRLNMMNDELDMLQLPRTRFSGYLALSQWAVEKAMEEPNGIRNLSYVGATEPAEIRRIKNPELLNDVENSSIHRCVPRYSNPLEPPDDFDIIDTGDGIQIGVLTKDLQAFLDRRKNPVNPELATKERNTLLTIIAALCDYSAVKHQDRGAAVQIASLTDEIGAPVSDDTVRKVLAKIPNALETRKK